MSVYGEIALQPTSEDGVYQTAPYASATTDWWTDFDNLVEAIITDGGGELSCVTGYDLLPDHLRNKIHHYPDLAPTAIRGKPSGMCMLVVFAYSYSEDGDEGISYSAIVEMTRGTDTPVTIITK
jgi:hypothetical protein